MTASADISLEQAAVGAVVFWPHDFAPHLNKLDPLDFEDPDCRAAWQIMKGLEAVGRPISRVTVFAEMGIEMDEEETFAIAVDRVKSDGKPSFDDIALVLKKKASLRRIARLGEMATDMAHRQGVEPGDVIADLAAELNDIEASTHPEQKLDWTFEEMVTERLTQLSEGENVTIIPTGFPSLDNLVQGVGRKQVVTISGKSSMGKTTLIVPQMLNFATNGYGVAVCSLEMSMEAMVDRTISVIMHEKQPVPYRELSDPANPIRDDHERLKRIVHEMYAERGLPIHFNFRGGQTVAGIAGTVRDARRWISANGQTLDVLIIDYLDLMEQSDRYRGNKTQEITEIVKAVYELAKRENIAVILLCQLNRKDMTKDGETQRPTMENLRNSDAIGQYSDQVWFIHRPVYDIERKAVAARTLEDLKSLANDKHKFEIIVGKHRAGMTGSVEMWCDMPSSYLRDPQAAAFQEAAE